MYRKFTRQLVHTKKKNNNLINHVKFGFYPSLSFYVRFLYCEIIHAKKKKLSDYKTLEILFFFPLQNMKLYKLNSTAGGVFFKQCDSLNAFTLRRCVFVETITNGDC